MLERMEAAWQKYLAWAESSGVSHNEFTRVTFERGFQAGVEAQRQADREWLDGALTSGDESGEDKAPELVPVLKPHMICHGEFSGPGGTHCLVGWCEVFNATPLYGRAYRAMMDAAGIRNSLAEWNDSHSATEAAELWNKSIPSLGYMQDGEVFRLVSEPTP